MKDLPKMSEKKKKEYGNREDLLELGLRHTMLRALLISVLETIVTTDKNLIIQRLDSEDGTPGTIITEISSKHKKELDKLITDCINTQEQKAGYALRVRKSTN